MIKYICLMFVLMSSFQAQGGCDITTPDPDFTVLKFKNNQGEHIIILLGEEHSERQIKREDSNAFNQIPLKKVDDYPQTSAEYVQLVSDLWSKPFYQELIRTDKHHLEELRALIAEHGVKQIGIEKPPSNMEKVFPADGRGSENPARGNLELFLTTPADQPIYENPFADAQEKEAFLKKLDDLFMLNNGVFSMLYHEDKEKRLEFFASEDEDLYLESLRTYNNMGRISGAIKRTKTECNELNSKIRNFHERLVSFVNEKLKDEGVKIEIAPALQSLGLPNASDVSACPSAAAGLEDQIKRKANDLLSEVNKFKDLVEQRNPKIAGTLIEHARSSHVAAIMGRAHVPKVLNAIKAQVCN